MRYQRLSIVSDVVGGVLERLTARLPLHNILVDDIAAGGLGPRHFELPVRRFNAIDRGLAGQGGEYVRLGVGGR